MSLVTLPLNVTTPGCAVQGSPIPPPMGLRQARSKRTRFTVNEQLGLQLPAKLPAPIARWAVRSMGGRMKFLSACVHTSPTGQGRSVGPPHDCVVVTLQNEL